MFSCASHYVRPQGVRAPERLWLVGGKWKMIPHDFGTNRVAAAGENQNEGLIAIFDAADGNCVAKLKMKTKNINQIASSVLTASSKEDRFWIYDADKKSVMAYDIGTASLQYQIPVLSKPSRIEVLSEMGLILLNIQKRFYAYSLTDGVKQWISEEYSEIANLDFLNYQAYTPPFELPERNEFLIVGGLRLQYGLSGLCSEGKIMLFDAANGKIKMKQPTKLMVWGGELTKDEIQSMRPVNEKLVISITNIDNKVYLSSFSVAAVDLDSAQLIWERKYPLGKYDQVLAQTAAIALASVSFSTTQYQGGISVTTTYHYYYNPTSFYRSMAESRYRFYLPQFIGENMIHNDDNGNLYCFSRDSGTNLWSQIVKDKEYYYNWINVISDESAIVRVSEASIKRYGLRLFNPQNNNVKAEFWMSNQIIYYSTNSKGVILATGYHLIQLDENLKEISKSTFISANGDAALRKVEWLIPMSDGTHYLLGQGDRIFYYDTKTMSVLFSRETRSAGVSSAVLFGNYLAYQTLDSSGKWNVWSLVDVNTGKLVYEQDATSPNFLEFEWLNRMVAPEYESQHQGLGGYSIHP